MAAPFERCDVTVAVLTAIVRSHDEQPLGLEKACVEKYAALNGKVYVDVRFVRDGQIEAFEDSVCLRDDYVIRFDSRNYMPSLAPAVVLLHVYRKDSKTIEFDAVTEDRLWPQKHAQTLYSSSPCFSSHGFASFGPNGWEALPAAPTPPDSGR